ncbi:MAG: tetratricopeptide repeat protein [Actinobacteria bacterium]|nr:tetratricopeptide repeat protein [Actinomycetota bacterium]
MTTGSALRTQRIALNGDIVGYSRLLADDYESTTATMAGYRRLLDEQLDLRHGVMANFVGDSFMAVFDDPVEAIRAAIAVTTAIEAANADVAPVRRVEFRMGADAGEVGVTDGNYHGDALNTAARIQAITRPGGIGISGSVYRMLDEPALRFRPLGRHRLKNIPEGVEVYELADLPSDRPPAPGDSLALASPTMAVLPIHTEMVDETVRAAAAMIRQDLIHRLSSIPELDVLEADLDVSTGRLPAHGARYMLETGVHQFDDRARVYAMLYDVTTMNVVKSHKWMSPVDGLFDLSETIGDEVARSVEVDLIVGEPAGFYAELDDPEAIERIYLGWYHLRADTREGWIRALDLFGRVAASHPGQPYGHGLSAFAEWLGVANGWANDPAAALQRSRDLARTAGQVGDPTGLGQAVEAAILMVEGRIDEALEALENLVIVRPTCDITYGLEGSIRRYLGDWQRAVELLDTAMRLTGINKPWYPTVKACSLFVGERYDQAASIAESVLEYQPHNLEAMMVLAAAQAELGLDRRARATGERIREQYPSIDAGEWLDGNPYLDRAVVDRWRADLIASGLPAGDSGDPSDG